MVSNAYHYFWCYFIREWFKLTNWKRHNLELQKEPLEQVKSFDVLSDPLNKLAIQRYCKNKSKLNSFSSTYNLPNKNGRTYLINLGKYDAIETQFAAIYAIKTQHILIVLVLNNFLKK